MPQLLSHRLPGRPRSVHAEEVPDAGLLPGPSQADQTDRPRPLPLLQERSGQGEVRLEQGFSKSARGACQSGPRDSAFL